MISSESIRQQFIDFFIDKKHIFVPSASVIPMGDPTLLFTNAGMNQFKDIFLGNKESYDKRAVNSQKCIRAGGKHNDLEEVGRDGFHHTFFEMLGNWSFGDYYKKEAIKWAWELLTEVWKLPTDKLYATVHDSDEEAYQIWKNETTIDPNHIQYHGDKDNFWEMGNTGPCGPCSEIHIDRGADYCNRKEAHECQVNGDCHRYIELWNLVFIQYNRDESGKLHPLQQKYVDTGAGFERLAQILQQKKSNYDTDIFMPIIKNIEKISNREYAVDERGLSHRVIADHIRALTFAIADGGMPSNEGRGYVLRRILRRAARHGRKLGFSKPFLYLLVDSVCRIMSNSYPELKEQNAHIKMIIKAEEDRFNQTLDNGLIKFNERIEKNDFILSGKDAFMLYDTFGFPIDLTRILAEEKGRKVDEKGFLKAMEAQRQRAREAAKFQYSAEEENWVKLKELVPTEFVGYQQKCVQSNILQYSHDENNTQIVLDKTPFYAESGGQIADIGRIYNEDCEMKVIDVQKKNDLIIHFVSIQSGVINDLPFTACIEQEFRQNVARNHTATHLLHKALKSILGDHVQQKGSLVHADYLRFDFTHFQALSDREMRMTEEIVNRQIRACSAVSTKYTDIDQAKQDGAVALFGEKYGKTVRVVSIDEFSMELCGGTHVNYTGEIGIFKFISESSIAAGIRRVEAITGVQAEKYVQQLEDDFEQISIKMSSPRDSIVGKIEKMTLANKELQQKVTNLTMQQLNHQIDNLVNQAERIKNIAVITSRIEVSNSKILRTLGDELKQKLKSGVGVLIAVIDEKISILVIVTADLTKQFHAGKIADRIAQEVGGKGGGRPDMAMAGGKDTNKIEAALQKAREIISQS